MVQTVFNPHTNQLDMIADGNDMAALIKNLQTPAESPNGAIVLFTAPDAYVAGTMRVFRDQSILTDDDFSETDPTAGTFTVDEAPDANEIIRCTYILAP